MATSVTAINDDAGGIFIPMWKLLPRWHPKLRHKKIKQNPHFPREVPSLRIEGKYGERFWLPRFQQGRDATTTNALHGKKGRD